uniref:Ionotropic glutamate receptor C-terminal domain-containing protein n=1 Tax=Anopheles atroparvus TaxID=41427 RepID=A0A182J763_ANOAO
MLMNGSLSSPIKPSAIISANSSVTIVPLLDCLLLRYFVHFFAVCFIRVRGDQLHYNAPVPTVVIEVEELQEFEKMLTIGVDLGCQSFIVTERAVDPFFEAFLPAHDAAVQRTVPKRLIMVLQPNSTVFPRLPQMLIIEELPELLIILPTEKRSGETVTRIELYTVDLYEGDPVSIVPRLLDVVEDAGRPCDDLHQNDHFPDKFSNMNKRRLRVGMAPYIPNTHVEDMPLGEGNARYILPPKPNVSAQISGTELWFVVLFCETSNCTPEVTIESEWGAVFENGSSYGVIGRAVEHQVDIILAALYTWYSTYQFLAFTVVHSRSGCTCLVAKPRLVTNWSTPFQSFTGALWSAVFVAFLGGALALLVVSRGRQRILALDASTRLSASDSVLLMIGFFMEQSVPMPNELVASCVLFGTLMFAGFMIGSSYNGGLASTMIVPQYEKTVDTVHDLAATRTTWVGVTLSWIYSILLAPQPDLRTLLETFREWDDQEIDRHAFDRDVAIIVERLEHGYFAIPGFNQEALRGRRMLRDDIYWESVIGMCTKTWPARARFDRMVLDLKAHGILAHWELIAVMKYLSLSSQQTIRYSRDTGDDEVMPLRVANVTGALLILGAGLSLAAAVFIAELLCYKYLLTHLLAVYYADHQSVCVIRTPTEDIRIGEHSLPQVQLVLEASRDEGSLRLLQQAIEAGCDGFVVTDGALLPFLDRYHEAHMGAITQSEVKRLVGVLAHLDDEQEVRSKLLAHGALESLVNILLLAPNATAGTVGLYTTRLRPTVPIGTTIDLVQIAELKMASGDQPRQVLPPLPELEYFPDKISNMQGGRVRVSTLSYPPCTTWREVPLGEGNAMDMAATNHSVLVDGLELVLTLEFCHRHNCTLELVLGSDWGTVLKDGTTTGLLHDMTQNRADLVLGAIYEWFTPFLSFPPSLWMMVGVALLFGTLAVFAIDLYRHHRIASNERHHQYHHRSSSSSRRLLLFDALLFMIRLYVGQSARLRNDIVTAVILLATLLYGGFMIGNSYAGALASIMTLPRYEMSIDTVADFVEREMRWTGGSAAWMTSLADATEPTVVRMRDSFEVHDDETSAQLPFTDDRMGYVFERFQYGNYGFGTRIDLNASRRLQSLTQIIFREYTGGFCSKVWPLRGAYDRFILELHQSGILHYLELTSVIRLSGLSIQRNIQNARVHEADGEPVKLTIDHFLGVFFILFLGLSLAISKKGTLNYDAAVRQISILPDEYREPFKLGLDACRNAADDIKDRSSQISAFGKSSDGRRVGAQHSRSKRMRTEQVKKPTSDHQVETNASIVILGFLLHNLPSTGRISDGGLRTRWRWVVLY